MVTCDCNPSSPQLEEEAGGQRAGGRYPGLHSDHLAQKKKKKNGWDIENNLWGRRICKDHSGHFCLLLYDLQHIG